MPGVWLIIEGLIAKLGGRALASVATRLAALTGVAVEGTVAGIMSATKTFVGFSMSKFSMISSVLIAAGISVPWDEIYNAAPQLRSYDKQFQAITAAALGQLQQESADTRHELTGDGKDNGMDVPLATAMAGSVLIKKATFATGNLRNLESLREVMFMDESTFNAAVALTKRQ